MNALFRTRGNYNDCAKRWSVMQYGVFMSIVYQRLDTGYIEATEPHALRVPQDSGTDLIHGVKAIHSRPLYMIRIRPHARRKV